MIVAATLINLWVSYSDEILMKKDGIQRKYKNNFCEWIGTNKPFNCGDCISLWMGVILLILLNFNIFFLSLPLFYRITFRLWK